MKQVLARTTDSLYHMAMDIGLGKFLEMFEERCGRKATTVLLFLIALGAVAVVISPIYDHLIMPLYSFAGVIVGKTRFPAGLTLTWVDVSQILLTILQVMLIIVLVTVGSIMWVTTIHLAMREFVFDYWRKYFRERRKNKLAKKSAKESKDRALPSAND